MRTARSHPSATLLTKRPARTRSTVRRGWRTREPGGSGPTTTRPNNTDAPTTGHPVGAACLASISSPEDSGAAISSGSILAPLLQCSPDGLEQDLGAERLAQISDRPGPHRP